MTYNAATRADVKVAAKAAKLADAQDREVITALMSHLGGRAYLWRRLAAAHVFHTSFDLNPLNMAFREGERNQGLQLLTSIMQFCPSELILMLREANERDSAIDADRNNRARARGDDPAPDGADEEPAADDGAGEAGANYVDYTH